MASYNELNALIDAYINRNGVQAITGQILNGVLKAMVEQIGRGYAIMGVVEPGDDPGTPDAPEAYFASTTGTYTNFGGIILQTAEFALLAYTPSEGWTKKTIYEGISQVDATIDANVGTPQVIASYSNGVLSFDFRNLKGNTGDPAGFGTVAADVDANIGTPAVSVESSGPDTAKNMTFHFRNLKGETGVTSVVATVDNTTGNPSCAVSLVGQELHLDFTGLKGAQGDTGVSADFPITIANNLTTDDPTAALSAAQGVVLAGELSQLEHKVDDLSTGKYYGYFATSADLPDDATVDGFAYVGTASPYTIYNCVGGVWTSSGITVNQSPFGNDEDIDQNEAGKLQFANRTYNAQQPNGMGYKILRKDATFASQVTDANTIYEIRYPFNLNGASVSIPSGCILRFDGGTIDGGTLNGNNTKIEDGVESIFGNSLTIGGTWDVPFARPEWFSGNDSVKIQSAFAASNTVKCINGKQYNCPNTISLIDGQSLILSDSKIRDSYDKPNSNNTTTILFTEAPAISMLCGASLCGGRIKGSVADGNSAILLKYRISGNGNPSGTFIEGVQIENTATRDFTSATGYGFLFEGETYDVNIVRCCFRYFNTAIYSPVGANQYICTVDSRFEYCRHIVSFKAHDLTFYFRGQFRTLSQAVADIDVPVIDLRDSYGFVDGELFDINGGNYKFSKILSSSQLNGTLDAVRTPLTIGPRLSGNLRSLGQLSVMDDSAFYDRAIGKYYGGLGYYLPNLENDLFKNLLKTDFSVNLGGNTRIITAIDSLLKTGDFSDGRFIWEVAADTDYLELDFQDFKQYQFDAVRTLTPMLSDFACVFESATVAASSNRTPKMVLVSILDVNNREVKYAIYSRTLTKEDITQLYPNETSGDVIFIKEKPMSEFSIDSLFDYGVFRNSAGGKKSINIKMYGSIHATNRVVMIGLHSTIVSLGPTSQLTGNNRWRGDNRFTGKVFLEGNVVASSARPTGVPDGYQIFDTTLGKPLWRKGSAWVDATGTAV